MFFFSSSPFVRRFDGVPYYLYDGIVRYAARWSSSLPLPPPLSPPATTTTFITTTTNLYHQQLLPPLFPPPIIVRQDITTVVTFCFRLHPLTFLRPRYLAALALKYRCGRPYRAWVRWAAQMKRLHHLFAKCFWPLYIWRKSTREAILERQKACLLKRLYWTSVNIRLFRAWRNWALAKVTW
jgi:hypothetical protein